MIYFNFILGLIWIPLTDIPPDTAKGGLSYLQIG
jgi:hypothetical protein